MSATNNLRAGDIAALLAFIAIVAGMAVFLIAASRSVDRTFIATLRCDGIEDRTVTVRKYGNGAVTHRAYLDAAGVRIYPAQNCRVF